MTKSYSSPIRQQAIALRKQGHSLYEISKKLSISKSTCSLWLRHIIIPNSARKRLMQKIMIGRRKGVQSLREKQEAISRATKEKVREMLAQIAWSGNICKVLCAVFMWTEGSKLQKTYRLGFTNSDPVMVQTFLSLLRKSYKLDEQKFRVLLHLHKYHNERTMREYWSRATQIPLSQFNKCYIKSSTKKIIREGYKGCASVRYFDSKIAREIKMIYNILPQIIQADIRGVG